MLKVGLTGNIGCGKSTVADMFKKLGAYVFDADKIIKDLYQERGDVYRRVIENFGSAVLDEEGNIDRKKLADLVFSDIKRLRVLEEITHSALYTKLEDEFKSLPQKAIAIVEASLLVEKGTYKNYDKLIVVYAPYEICKERAIKAGFPLEDFKRRWEHQLPPEEKVKYADFVIDNSDGIKQTQKQVKEVYEKLSRLIR
ncbi:MAG: dephospho-CoA kinase [Hydrogenobacter sp.]|uniref:dephospho-CoA kinase n=1 Tax=Hydrogenobacter thermophilus TaxID=940 RepID=UPI0030F794A1